MESASRRRDREGMTAGAVVKKGFSANAMLSTDGIYKEVDLLSCYVHVGFGVFSHSSLARCDEILYISVH